MGVGNSRRKRQREKDLLAIFCRKLLRGLYSPTVSEQLEPVSLCLGLHSLV